jgi:hypothetical protein
MSHHRLLALLAFAALVTPSRVRAEARLISVVPMDGACVSGPTGPGVQRWDVESGKTYEITISHVVECAHGGTDATLGVRVMSTSADNTDLVATLVVPGTYKFSLTLLANSVCTMPIRYCTTPGDMSSGLKVNRSDGEPFQAHLRVSTFEPGCANPVGRSGDNCQSTPTRSSNWAMVKQYYR